MNILSPKETEGRHLICIYMIDYRVFCGRQPYLISKPGLDEYVEFIWFKKRKKISSMSWPYKENLIEGRKVDNDSAMNERILLSFVTFILKVQDGICKS